MLIYQVKIEIKPYKPDEFVKNMGSFLPKICRQKGCLDFCLYQAFVEENTFIVVGEWRTRQGMEKHFQTKEFELWTARSVSKKAKDQLSKAGWVIHTDVWAKLKEKLEPKTQ